MSNTHPIQAQQICYRLCFAFLLFGVHRPAHAEETPQVNLVSELQLKHQISQHEAAEQVERVFSLIREDLKKGKTIEVRNFGKFGVRVAKVRQKKAAGFQGPLLEAGKKRYPQFSAAPSLREDLNL